MKLHELSENPQNPRKIDISKLEKLKNSIREFPAMMELRPIIVDAANVILGGNMRFFALRELGYIEIPDTWVKRAADLTEEEKQRFIIADNVGYGDWDWYALQEDWDAEDLGAWGLEVPGWQGKDQDYSEKNKEIDIDALDALMTLNLKYNEGDYWKVREQLSKIAQTPEQAVWKLLGNE